jgi:hypothetical protein
MLVACGRVDIDELPPGAVLPCGAPWSAPVEVIGTGFEEPSISSDDLELYINDTGSSAQLWVAKRADRTQPFGAAAELGMPPNLATADVAPSISGDGLDVYYTADINSQAVVVASHRASIAAPFEPAAPIGPYGGCDVSFDGLSMYCQDFQTPIVVWQRATKSDAFATPVDLGPVINDGSTNLHPSISADELDLYFDSDRGGVSQIWVASRAHRTEAFETVTPLTMFPNAGQPEISTDGRHLYFNTFDAVTMHTLVASRCD